MKSSMVCSALVAAVLACGVSPAAAQSGSPQAAPAQAGASPSGVDQAIEQLRKDVRTEVNSIIGASMKFTSDEAATFWPLYKTYEERRKALTSERIAIIKDYAANFTAMNDAKALELMQRALALEQKNAEAKRGFLAELQKALPGKTVARFYQVHTRIDTLVDLMMAQEVPVVR